jgi:plastocyanin
MRIPRFIAAVTVTALCALGAACGDSTNPAGGNSVSVEDNLFDPDNLSVPAGTTVTWTWNGAADHNVTWTGQGAPAPSPTQASGTYSRTFAAAGTFDYFCTIHGQSMSGTVVVQ